MGAIRYFAPPCMSLSLPSLLSMLFVGHLSLRCSAEVLKLNFGPPTLHIPDYEVAYRSDAFVQWGFSPTPPPGGPPLPPPPPTFYFGTSFGGYWSNAGGDGTNHSKHDDSVEGSSCSIADGEYLCLIGVPIGTFRLTVMAGDRLKPTDSCFSLLSGESVYDATTTAAEFKNNSVIVQKQSWIDNLCLGSCRTPSIINSWEIEKVNCDSSCAFCTGTAAWQCTISCTNGRIYTPEPGVNGTVNRTYCVAREPYAAAAPTISEILNFSVRLDWVEPVTGGLPISGYRILKAVGHGSTVFEEHLATTGSSDTFTIVTNLNGNTVYKFKIQGINAVGIGNLSDSTIQIITAPVIPIAPEAPEPLDIDQYSMLLNWSSPVYDGGSPVLSYIVDVIDVPNGWSTIPTTSMRTYTGLTDMPLLIGGLQGCHLYSFQVAAVNAIGIGPFSSPCVPTRTLPVPPGPSSTPVISDLEQYALLLSWTRPAFEGGSNVTSYDIECREDSVESGPFKTMSSNWHSTAQSVAVRIPNLVGYTEYACRVAGINGIGRGIFSAVSLPSRTLPVPPSAPGQPFGIESEKHALRLQWSEPSVEVGSETIGYKVWGRHESEAEFTVLSNDTGSNMTEFYATDLEGFSPYVFKVAAINGIGLGDESLQSGAVWTKGVGPRKPEAPFVFNITSSSFQLSWVAPMSGGSNITGYWIELAEGSSAYIRMQWLNSTNLTTKLTGLLGSETYRVRVVAVNAIEESPPGEVTLVTTLPPLKPDPPTGLQINITAPYAVSLGWVSPVDEQGRPVSHYVISVSLQPSNVFVDTINVSSPGTLGAVTELLGGQSYKFRVQAVNEVGRSDGILASATMPPAIAPAAVGKPMVSDIQQHSVNLTWADPSHDGGARVSSFGIWLRHEGGAWSLHSTVTGIGRSSALVQNLIGDTMYHFAVEAINSAGSAPLSLSSEAITTLEVPPFAPGQPQASDVQSYTLNLAWNAPSKDGGYAIQGYQIWVYQDGTSVFQVYNDTESNSTSFFIEGLKGNTPYKFTVAGINALGLGEMSALSDSVKTLPVPPDAPAAPSVNSLSPSSALLSWTPTYDGGAPVLGYEVQFARTGHPFSVVANLSVLSHNLTLLLGATSYTARLIAYNSRGYSAPGAAVVWVTPLPTPPSSPTTLDVAYDFPYQATLTWQIPVETGGRPILGYHVSYAKSGEDFQEFAIAAPVARSMQIPRLLGNTSYVFRVQAFTSAGKSLAVEMTKTSPAPILPAITGDPKITEIGQHHVAGTFELPEHDGGARISSFLVWAHTGGIWSHVATVSYTEPLFNISADISFIVPGLIGDTRYRFRVQAVNAVGTGNFSTTSKEIWTLPVPPFAPGTPVITDVRQHQLTLAWEAPSKDGGYAIIGYKVWQQMENDDAWSEIVNSTESNSTYWVVTGLKGFTVFRYKVAGINDLGIGEISGASALVRTLPVPPDAPQAPLIDSITHSSMQLSWLAPKDGGSPILSYFLEIAEGMGSFTELANVTGLTHTVTGLLGSTQYRVRVIASSAYGLSVPSGISVKSTLSPVVPETPIEIVVSFAAPHTALVQWSPPEDDGGRPIIAYDISYGLFGDSHVHFARVGPNEQSVSVTDLLGATTYVFGVAAVNEVGSSIRGDKVGTSPLAVPPAPPSSLVADEEQQYSVRLSWIDSMDDGGSPIVQLLIWAEVDSQWSEMTRLNGSDFNSTELVDLVGDTSYRFRIQAVNAAGIGPFSSPSNSIRTLQIPPSEPQLLRSTNVGQHEVQLQWNAPLKDGGYKVLEYVVEARHQGTEWFQLVVGNFTSWLAGNLRGNTLYEFRVAAINTLGVGLWSASHDVQTLPIPPEPPSAVNTGLMTPSTAQILWMLPPSDGGMPILGYTVEFAQDNVSFSFATNTTGLDHTLVHLLGSMEYQVRVFAFNAVGKSLPSDSLIFTTVPPVAPGAPTGLSVSFLQPYLARFIWSPPLDDGGSTVLEYYISYAKVGSPFEHVQIVSAMIPVEVSDLFGSINYMFRVHARNAIGMSPGATLPITSPVPVPPAAPTIFSVSDVGQYTATITWDAPIHNGGAPILGVNVFGESDGSWASLGYFGVGEANSTSLSGLLGNTVYRFRLQAVNSAGAGPNSSISFSVRTQKIPPMSPSTPIAEKVEKFELLISWQAPVNDGGSEIVGYSVRQRHVATSQWTVFTSNDTTWLSTDLDGDTVYVFSVAGINAVGLGTWSAEAYLRTAPLRPSAPGQPVVSSTGQQWAMLHWEPSDGNGAPVNFYQIAVQVDGSGPFSIANANTGSDKTIERVDNLLGNTPYSFKVRAKNFEGFSDWSEASNLTSTGPEIPSPPQNVSVSGLTPSPVTVTFLPPLSDGGSAVHRYELFLNAPNQIPQSGGLIFASDPPAAEYTIQVSNLLEGVSYTFCVKAMNGIGLSDCGLTVFSPGYYGTPGKASTKPLAVAFATNAVELSWGQAEWQGGAHISGWNIYLQTRGGSWYLALTTSGVDTKAWVSGLAGDTEYRAKVQAFSKLGDGNFSDDSDFFRTWKSTPSPLDTAPVLSYVTLHDTLWLTWQTPASGGWPIDAYEVHCAAGDYEPYEHVAYSPVTSASIGNIIGNVTYRCKVAAINRLGRADFSAPSNPVLTLLGRASAPGKPTAVSAGGLSMRLTWLPPYNDGGSDITGYRLWQKALFPAGAWTQVADIGTSTAHTVNNLQPGTLYTFRVAAINAYGVGLESEDSDGLYSSKRTPGPPEMLRLVETSITWLEVAWGLPQFDGGSAVIGYSLEMKAALDDNFTVVATLAGIGNMNFNVTDLESGSRYAFQVRAINAIGTGDASIALFAWTLLADGSAVITTTSTTSTTTAVFTLPWTTTSTTTTTFTLSWTTTGKGGSSNNGNSSNSSNGSNNSNTSAGAGAGAGAGGAGGGAGAGAGTTTSGAYTGAGAGAGAGAGTTTSGIGYSGTGTTTSAFGGAGTTSSGGVGGTTSSGVVDGTTSSGGAGGGVGGTTSTTSNGGVDGTTSNGGVDGTTSNGGVDGTTSSGDNGNDNNGNSNDIWNEQFPSPPSPDSRPIATDITCNSVELSWSPPEHEGASPIVGYAIWAKELTTAEPFQLLISNTGSATPQATVSGLRGRVPYSFRVQGINSRGAGFVSNSSLPAVTAYCAGSPFGPGNLTSGNSSGGNSSNDILNGPWDPTAAICMAPTEVVASWPAGRAPLLSWIPPACSPKYGYRVWIQRNGFGLFTAWPVLPSGGDTSFELVGLMEKDTWLSFQIQAVGAAGPGILSRPTDPIISRSSTDVTDVTNLPSPGQPQLGAFIAERHLVLSWSAPDSTDSGISPIGYRLLRREGLWSGSDGFIVDGAIVTELSTVSYDLNAEQRYEFAVQALWPGNVWGLMSEVSLPFVPSTLTRSCSSSCGCSGTCAGPCLVHDLLLTSASPASCGTPEDGCPNGLFADSEGGLCVQSCPEERPYWTNTSGVLSCYNACPSELVADGYKCAWDCSMPDDNHVLVLYTNFTFFTCVWANESYPRLELTFDLDYHNQPASMAMRVVHGISAAVSEPTHRFGIQDIREGSIIVKLVIFKFPGEALSVPQNIGRFILDSFKEGSSSLMNQQPPIFPALIGVSLTNAPFCVNGNCTIMKGGTPLPPDSASAPQVTAVASAVVPLVLVAMAMAGATWWWQRKGRPHPAWMDKLKSKDHVSKFAADQSPTGSKHPPFLEEPFDPSTQQVIDIVASPKTVDPTKPTLPPYPRRWILEHLRKRQLPAPPQPPTLPTPPQPPSLPGGGETPQPRKMESGDWVQLEEGPRSPAAHRDRVPTPQEITPPVPPSPVQVPSPPTPPFESPRDGFENVDLWKCSPPSAPSQASSLGTPRLAPQEAELSRDLPEDGVSEGGDASTEAPSPKEDLNFFNFKVDGKDNPHASTGGSVQQPESEPPTAIRTSERIDEIINDELSKIPPRNIGDDLDDEEDEDEILRLLMAEGDCPEVAVPPPRGHAPWVLETWKPFYRDEDEASDEGSTTSQNSLTQKGFNDLELPNCISTQG